MLFRYLFARFRAMQIQQQLKMLRASMERIEEYEAVCGFELQHYTATEKELQTLQTLLAQIN